MQQQYAAACYALLLSVAVRFCLLLPPSYQLTGRSWPTVGQHKNHFGARAWMQQKSGCCCLPPAAGRWLLLLLALVAAVGVPNA
jgi:hypothetical protein